MKKVTVIVMAIVMSVGFAFAITGCGQSADVEPTETEATEATDSIAGASGLVDYSVLAGDYEDEVGQRATMHIDVEDDEDGVEIEVSWSSSANETTTWSMDATLKDNKLVYNECEKETKTYDESGAEISEEETELGSGYFLIGEGNALLWEGASEDSCKECRFVKINQ